VVLQQEVYQIETSSIGISYLTDGFLLIIETIESILSMCSIYDLLVSSKEANSETTKSTEIERSAWSWVDEGSEVNVELNRGVGNRLRLGFGEGATRRVSIRPALATWYRRTLFNT
jgi:hypothetical protein